MIRRVSLEPGPMPPPMIRLDVLIHPPPIGSGNPSAGPMERHWIPPGTRVGNYPASCPQSTTTSIKSVSAQSSLGILDARKLNDVLLVNVVGTGKHPVKSFSLSGQRLARQIGNGDKEYSFPNLKTAAVYLVQVKAGKQTLTRRVTM